MDSAPSTRDRILEVAGRLFTERGYNSTSVRDIAAELGIANPSLYHHFKSKADLLSELLKGPLDTVAAAVEAAQGLEGEHRTRHILGGLLQSLEMHSGIAITALQAGDTLPPTHRDLAQAALPQLTDLLADGLAPDRRELRVTMAIGAIDGVVTNLMQSSTDSTDFVARLRARRQDLIELTMKLLT